MENKFDMTIRLRDIIYIILLCTIIYFLKEINDNTNYSYFVTQETSNKIIENNDKNTKNIQNLLKNIENAIMSIRYR